MITFYGYKKCSTCRKAEQSLNKAGIAYEYVDITQAPPSATTIKTIAQQAQRTLQQMFNTSGVIYREQKIKARLADMSDSEKASLLAGEGRLIKRPIVTDGIHSTVGYNPKEFSSIWREE